MKDMLPKIQDFADFQNLKGCFLSEFDWIWFNLHRSASIYIDLHRSPSICLALNLKISCIFLRYQNFDSPSIFHMGEVKNWPPRRQWDSGCLGNFQKKKTKKRIKRLLALEVETFEKRKFLFIHKGKSHRLNPRFGEGSVFDFSQVVIFKVYFLL